MTSNLEYCFIEASPGAVRRAWRKWTDGAINDAYFVPAQGGCFLVKLKAAAYARPLAWLQNRADALTSRQREVERFKAAFDEGLVS